MPEVYKWMPEEHTISTNIWFLHKFILAVTGTSDAKERIKYSLSCGQLVGAPCPCPKPWQHKKTWSHHSLQPPLQSHTIPAGQRRFYSSSMLGHVAVQVHCQNRIKFATFYLQQYLDLVWPPPRDDYCRLVQYYGDQRSYLYTAVWFSLQAQHLTYQF